MKVALFTRFPQSAEQPRGGVESVSVVLVRALAELPDLELHVVTLEAGRVKNSMENHDGIMVHRLPGSHWPQIADVIGGPGRRRIIDHIRALKPDVLHSHETHGLMFGNLPIPKIFTVHGFDTENLLADAARFARLRSRLWTQVERVGLSRQRHIISITPYVRSRIEPITNAVIHDIENPVDQRFFHISPSPQRGRVLCVGWLNERKNTLGAIRAFGLAVARGNEGTLVLAGQAKEPAFHRKVMDCIASLELAGRVEMLGHVDHERLRMELAKATVMLLPSRQENSPMAIAEAMAAGVPVIASNRCGMPFMVAEGETGFLINPEDDGEIADRLDLLMRDPDKAQEMGRAARSAACQRFEPRRVAFRTREVYSDALREWNEVAPRRAIPVREPPACRKEHGD